MTTFKVVMADNERVLQQDVNALLADGYLPNGSLQITTDRDGIPKRWVQSLLKNELEPALSLSSSFSDSAMEIVDA